MKNRVYGIDIETDDPFLIDKGVSWVYGVGSIICVGLYDAQTNTSSVLDGNGSNVILKLLLDPDVTLVGTNIIYDLGWCCYEHKLNAKDIKCALVDISIAEAFIDEYQSYSLDDLTVKYLGERKQYDELKLLCEKLGYKGDSRKHLKTLWEGGYQDEIRRYVKSDASQPVRIWEKQEKVIKGLLFDDNNEFLNMLDKKLNKGSIKSKDAKKAIDLFNLHNIETALVTNFKLIKIVLGMKQRGVRVDIKKRQSSYKLLKGIQDKLYKQFEKRYGKVNFNSSKQLAELFNKEKVPYRCKIRVKCASIYDAREELKSEFNKIKVEKGQLVLYVPSQYAGRTNDQIISMGYETTCNPNIDKEAIKALMDQYEVAKAIVDLKQVTSILDKFLGEGFDRFIVKHGENNYRIHCDFNIVGARQTSRFSSSNPNLQQVPSKTVLFAGTENEIKLYKLCREIIIPDEGYLWCKADYSGQENRLMAHYAVGIGDDEIRQKYNDDPDFDEHQWVADTAKALLGVDLPRKIVKGIKFGLGYGQGLDGLCETNGWTKEEGQKLLDAYNRTVPFVKSTMDKVSEIITSRGYIKTLAGRHCHLENGNKREAYKGFNKLIQGSAADMIKKAMVMLDEAGLLDVFPLYLTVHDELDFGVNPKYKKRLKEVQKIMENTYPLSVPIRVDPEVGKNWGDIE